MKFTQPSDIALLLLRLIFGGNMLLNHGLGKVEKIWNGELSAFADPLGMGTELSLILAAFAEALCALLVTLGLYTRLATIPLIITMTVAAFVIHWSDPLQTKETGLLYLAAFTAIFLTGPGRYSLDEQFRKI